MVFDRKKTGELVIKPRMPPQFKLLVAAAASALLLGGAVYIYNYGLSMAGFERQHAEKTHQALLEENSRLKDENQQLRAALARAERAIQMDQVSYQELERSLKASAQEIVKLREELNFYRNIISPADKKAGLRIQSLEIEPAGANRYRYKLVLIQALKHERPIQGTAQFEIVGVQAGQETVWRHPGPNERAIAVNFKYFQDIEGRFDLPAGFVPRRIKVHVTAGGGQNVQAEYAWPEA
jgi:hypothetical protein